MPVRLSTNRLDLIAATYEHICAELETPERLATLLNAQVEPEWPPGEYDRDAQEFFRDRLKEGGEAVVGWYTWYAVRRADANQPSVLIGAGGYTGPPGDGGVVEIGLSIMPAWRGFGFAVELAEKLIENAFNDDRVLKVVARTAAANLASGRVLAKCGFCRVGSDENSGYICYELSRESRS